MKNNIKLILEIERMSQLMGVPKKQIITETTLPKLVSEFMLKSMKGTRKAISNSADVMIKLGNNIDFRINSSKLDEIIEHLTTGKVISKELKEILGDMIVKLPDVVDDLYQDVFRTVMIKEGVDEKTLINLFSEISKKENLTLEDAINFALSGVDPSTGKKMMDKNTEARALFNKVYKKTSQIGKGKFTPEVTIEPIPLDLGRKIFKKEQWDDIVITKDIVDTLIKKGDKDFINSLKNGIKLTENLTTETQTLIKAFTRAGDNVQLQNSILKQLNTNLKSIATHSTEELKLIISWIDNVRVLKGNLSETEKKGLENLSTQLRENTTITGYLKTAKELVPESKLGLAWESVKDAFDTIDNNLGFWSWVDRKTRVFDFSLEPTLKWGVLTGKEAEEKLARNGETWFNAWTTGHRKGWPSIDNPAWQKVIYQYGVGTARYMFFGTWLAKWIKYSVAVGIFDSIVEGLSWSVNQSKVKECENALSKLSPITGDETNEKLKGRIPESCKTNGVLDAIFFNAAWNYAHDSDNIYLRGGEKFWDSFFVEGFLKHLLPSTHDFFRIWPPSKIYSIFHTIYKYSDDDTYESLIKNFKAQRDKMAEIRDDAANEINKNLNITEEEAREKINEIVESISDGAEGFKNWLKNKGKSFKEWKNGYGITSDGKVYEWNELLNNKNGDYEEVLIDRTKKGFENYCRVYDLKFKDLSPAGIGITEDGDQYEWNIQTNTWEKV